MGPTRHRHNAIPRGGEWRKLLKLHPNNLILSNNSLFRYSLLLNGPNYDVIITNPFPEIAIFDLKGQERTHPLSFASCPEWRRAVFVFYVFILNLCKFLLRPTCTLHSLHNNEWTNGSLCLCFTPTINTEQHIEMMGHTQTRMEDYDNTCKQCIDVPVSLSI